MIFIPLNSSKMEENVALDSTKQRKFDKSIKGIKKLIKKKDAENVPKDNLAEKVKTGRVGKKKRPQKGLVYLSHIPHGFYENEMSQYFKQFGVVTNARVIKSKRTGRSKGFAFVEFKEPAVAQIVAETMNNYLMGKRLIKAAYIPPEKQKRKAFRRHWNAVNNPGNNLRIKMKKVYNENKDENGELKRARKLLSNINKTKKKLNELSINYDFFTPVDLPEVLAQNVQIKKENEDIKEKNVGKKKGVQIELAHVNKVQKDMKSKTKSSSNTEIKKEQNKKSLDKKTMKQAEMLAVADKNLQKRKKQNLKDKGVIPLEEFIRVENDTDNRSESSVDFDSDEYEKMLADDDGDSDLFENASGSDGTDDDVESDESEEKLPKQKGNKSKKPALNLKQATIMQLNKNANKKKTQTKQEPLHRQAKKKSQFQQKAPDSIDAESKKPKFEKQTKQKSRNKQFKKKT